MGSDKTKPKTVRADQTRNQESYERIKTKSKIIGLDKKQNRTCQTPLKTKSKNTDPNKNEINNYRIE